jgi:hypothetical protein
MTVHVSKLFGLLSPSAKAAIVLLAALAAVVHLASSGYTDWRVRELKLRALMVAFVSGWAFAGAMRFASYLQDRHAVPKVPSAYDAMFVMLVIANGLYLLWHHRDGRDAAAL